MRGPVEGRDPPGSKDSIWRAKEEAARHRRSASELAAALRDLERYASDREADSGEPWPPEVLAARRALAEHGGRG